MESPPPTNTCTYNRTQTPSAAPTENAIPDTVRVIVYVLIGSNRALPRPLNS